MPAEFEQSWQETCTLKWIYILTQLGISLFNIAIKEMKTAQTVKNIFFAGNKNKTTIFHV